MLKLLLLFWRKILIEISLCSIFVTYMYLSNLVLLKKEGNALRITQTKCHFLENCFGISTPLHFFLLKLS